MPLRVEQRMLISEEIHGIRWSFWRVEHEWSERHCKVHLFDRAEEHTILNLKWDSSTDLCFLFPRPSNPSSSHVKFAINCVKDCSFARGVWQKENGARECDYNNIWQNVRWGKRDQLCETDKGKELEFLVSVNKYLSKSVIMGTGYDGPRAGWFTFWFCILWI